MDDELNEENVFELCDKYMGLFEKGSYVDKYFAETKLIEIRAFMMNMIEEIEGSEE